MKALTARLSALFIMLLILFTACDNSTPRILESIEVDPSFTETEIRIEDYAIGTALPEATIIAHYSNGSTAAIAEGVTYSATLNGENIGGMTAMSKGEYTIIASYTEGSVSETADYTITVTGDPRLIISNLEGVDSFYDGDQYTPISAVAQYEDENGILTDIDEPSIAITDSEGKEVTTATTLKTGTYTAEVTAAEYQDLHAETTFYVSAGYIPCSFVISGDTVPDRINKSANNGMLDLSDLSITATYIKDGDNTSEAEYQTQVISGGTESEGVILTLNNEEITDPSSIDFSSFGKGTEQTLTVTVPKALLKAIKPAPDGYSATAYEGELLSGSLTLTLHILVVENPSITGITVKTEEATEAVPYVAGDTVKAENISFTFDDGTGANAYIVHGNAEGIAITLNDETINSDFFKLAENENTITISYGAATGSTTVKASPIAKAKEITGLGETSILTEYRVGANEEDTVAISLPETIYLDVKYEDNTTGTVTVADSSKATFILTRLDSLARSTEQITITSSNPATLSAADAGLYSLSVSYSSPEDFTHRQAEVFTPSEVESLSFASDVEIEVKKSAIISSLTLTNSTEETFKDYSEGDNILPVNAAFNYTNIYGDTPAKKTAADETFTLEYSLDNSAWTAVPAEGYMLTDETSYFRVRCYAEDESNEAYAVSETYTVKPIALLSPVSIAITEDETRPIEFNVDTAGLLGNPFSITDLSVTLGYEDGTTRSVAVIEEGTLINEDFDVKIGGKPYGSFTYSYDKASLGEQTVAVMLVSPENYKQRATKTPETASPDLTDGYAVTIKRNPIIKDAALSLDEGEVLYNNSKISASDITFTYVSNVGEETTHTAADEEVTELKIGAAAASEGILTVPSEYAQTAQITFSFGNADGQLDIDGIKEDAPAELVLSEGQGITTSYKATAPAFIHSLGETVTIRNLSGMEHKESTSDLSFRIGDETITVSGNILRSHEGHAITVYYDNTPILITEAIEYDAVDSIEVTFKEDAPAALIVTEADSAIEASDFIESIALNLESQETATWNEFTFDKSGDTSDLRSIVTLTPSVTVNGDTIKGEAITRQVVANEYELASYTPDAIEIEANGSVEFTVPGIFNRTDDSKAVFFLGYYDESGRTVAYGESDIHITTEGNALKESTEKGTEYITGYDITNTIVNSTTEAVTLHPILAPVTDYASLDENMVMTKADGKKAYDSIILGIPAAVTGIGKNGGEEVSPFQGNTTVRMIVFENDSKLSFIGNKAFQGMAFSYAEIPASVTVLAEGAFADYNASGTGAYLSVAEDSSLQTIGQWAFSGCGFISVRIPESVTSFTGAAFLDSKYLETVVLDTRNSILTLPDGIFNANNKAIESLFVPENITLSENTFGGMSIETIIINGQENTSDFADLSPWGAAEGSDVEWLIENATVVTATEYPEYLVPGEEFTATLTIIKADGSETTGTGIFTAPNEATAGPVSFTDKYTPADETTAVDVEFTVTIVDKKINDTESLTGFLSGSGTTAYVSESFTTEGFLIDRSVTIFSDGKEIGLTSAAAGANGYVAIVADGVTLKGLVLYPAISATSNENYILTATGIKNLEIENVTIDNSRTDSMVGGGVYLNAAVAAFIDTEILGQTMSLVPAWLEGSTVEFTDCVFGQNGGSYQWSRLLLAGEKNGVTVSNSDNSTFDRISVQGENNSSDDIEISWAKPKPWTEGTYENGGQTYTYYDPTVSAN